MLLQGGLLIEELNLKDCQIRNMGAYHIYQGIKGAPKLKKIVLDKNNLQGKSLSQLSVTLMTNTSLERLSAEDCNLCDFGVISIMDGLERNVTLRYMNLKHNKVGSYGAKSILACLKNASSGLQHLILSENPLEDEGGLLIATAITLNTSLIKLEM